MGSRMEGPRVSKISNNWRSSRILTWRIRAKKGIAHALRVLHVWEKAYPNASLEDELAFLDRLAPQLCA
uniref:Uncharacterized protein n=1 Tax=Hyaloperonospora arabidopsidis (strain Emoy2) TaxID=559515 RepID=M4BBR7_HYAAE